MEAEAWYEYVLRYVIELKSQNLDNSPPDGQRRRRKKVRSLITNVSIRNRVYIISFLDNS